MICFYNRFAIFEIMKMVQKNALCFILFFFSIFSVIAKEGPPSPYRTPLPPPPILPINENMYIVMIIALLFGIYIIYNNRVKAKTPI